MVAIESGQDLKNLKSMLKNQLGALSRMFDLAMRAREAIEAGDGDRLLDVTKEETKLELEIKSLDEEITQWRKKKGELSEEPELITVLNQIERVWARLMKRKKENELLLAEKMKEIRNQLGGLKKTRLIQKSYKAPYTGWTLRREDAFFVDKFQ
ncbi:MAG: flagellar export chaperone FlgN [bacterium]|nr:flagellar export chaperone FlgN [bacterium]